MRYLISFILTFILHGAAFAGGKPLTLNQADCLPVERLEFQGRKTPALFDKLTVDQESLSHVYVTYLRGQCALSLNGVTWNFLLRDAKQIQKNLLENILGNHFNSISSATPVICTKAGTECVANFVAQITTASQDGWSFDLREVIEVRETVNSVEIRISSKNHDGRQDIIGHGVGSKSVKEFASLYHLEQKDSRLVMTIESLNFSTIANGAEKLVLKFGRSNIDHKALNKFENKLKELFDRLTEYVNNCTPGSTL